MSDPANDPYGEPEFQNGSSGTSNTIKIAAAVAGIALLGFIALLAMGNEVSNGPNTDVVGKAAPLLEGASYTGQAYSLEEVLTVNRSGISAADQTWTVVNFFASWCTGCIVEHPDLVDFDGRSGPCTTELVGVAINDRPSDVAKFFGDRGGDWPVLVGDGSTTAIVGYGVTAPPETVVIGPSGVVAQKWIGSVTTEQLEGFFAQMDCTA